MSKTTILVVCAFAGAIILGTATLTPADPGNGIPARVSALESALADLADDFDAHNHDDDYVLAPAENLTLISGAVRANGTVARGKGFTSEYDGDGEYAVTFDEGTFSANPIIILQTWTIGVGTSVDFGLAGFSPDGFRVIMHSGEKAFFKFYAIGPQ